LLLFSYILGDTPKIVDEEGTKRGIGRYEDGSLKPIDERANDLYLLSAKSIGCNPKYKQNKTDKRLYDLYFRQNQRKYKSTFRETFQNWPTLINEIGRDPIVRTYFGREISYEDVSQNFLSNRR